MTTVRQPGGSDAVTRARRAGRLTALGALCVYLATLGGSLATSDALMAFEVTRSLVTTGSIAAPGNVLGWEHNRGIDGRYYSQFGLGQSVYNIPFYLAGSWAESMTGGRVGRPDTITKAAVAAASAFAAAAAVWLTFTFGYALTGRLRAAVFGAVCLAFGTLLWPYAKFGFNQPLATSLLIGATYAVWKGVTANRLGWLTLGGLGLAAGLLTRHEFALAGLPMAAAIVAAGGRASRATVARLLAFGGSAAVGLAAWMAYNDARFGHLLSSGYSPEFGHPLQGAWGLLLSPGASLFLYAPIALGGVIALVRIGWRDRVIGLLFGGTSVILFLLYASLKDWEGGRSYGPRYLVPLLPYICVALACWFAEARKRTRRLLAAACVASAIVQAPGVLVDFSKVAELDAQTSGESHAIRHSSWRSAPLMLNARATAVAVPANVGYLLAGRSPARAQPPSPGNDRGFSRQYAFSLDFWWLYLFHMGALRAPAAVALGGLPWAAALGLAIAIRREIRRDTPGLPGAGPA